MDMTFTDNGCHILFCKRDLFCIILWKTVRYGSLTGKKG